METNELHKKTLDPLAEMSPSHMENGQPFTQLPVYIDHWNSSFAEALIIYNRALNRCSHAPGDASEFSCCCWCV